MNQNPKKSKQAQMQEELAKKMAEQREKLAQQESRIDESLGDKVVESFLPSTPVVEPLKVVVEPPVKEQLREPVKESEVKEENHVLAKRQVEESIVEHHHDEAPVPTIKVGQGLLDGFVEFLNDLGVAKSANNSVYLDDDANEVLEDLQIAFKGFAESKKAGEKKVILSKIVLWFAKTHREELSKMRRKADRKNRYF